jgi:hypothetical protein
MGHFPSHQIFQLESHTCHIYTKEHDIALRKSSCPRLEKANEITYELTSDCTQEDRKAEGSADTLHSGKPPT